jgi:hypothetical protein
MGAPLGNKNNKKNQYWSDALRKYIAQNPSDLAEAAQAIFTKAKEGDINAIKEIGDRLEGKAIQRVEGSGEDGAFITKMVVELVEADGSSKR